MSNFASTSSGTLCTPLCFAAPSPASSRSLRTSFHSPGLRCTSFLRPTRQAHALPPTRPVRYAPIIVTPHRFPAHHDKRNNNATSTGTSTSSNPRRRPRPLRATPTCTANIDPQSSSSPQGQLRRTVLRRLPTIAVPKLSPLAMARFELALVPILWASYSIVVKTMYTLPWAFGAATFNVLRLCISLVALFPIMFRYCRDRIRRDREGHHPPMSTSTSLPAATAAPLAIEQGQQQYQEQLQQQIGSADDRKSGIGKRSRNPLASLLTPTVIGGCELGVWTCAVNVLQLIGLRFTSASRGAFLTQLCTVIVPLAGFATGSEPTLSRSVVVASVMSVLGVGMLTLGDATAPFTLLGDGLLLVSAFVSAAYVMRSKTYAAHISKDSGDPDGIIMVAFKVLAQMLCSVLFLVTVNAAQFTSLAGVRAAMAHALVGVTPAMLAVNLALMAFMGIGLSVWSTVIQIRGQKMVSASEAVIIFTSTPLWTALMAIPLGERFGMRGVVGAFLIFAATVLCSSTEQGKGKEKEAAA